MELSQPLPEATPPQGPSPNGQQPDILKILWRWKWLPILGGLIGLIVGYLVYGQQPPQYKAVALVRVESPNNNFPIDPMNSGMERGGKGDELVVIRSNAVLSKAVDTAKLTQHKAFAEMTRNDIVNWLKEKHVLETKLGSTDPNSNILQIGITTNDAELSGVVLAAVVAGYQSHTESRIREASDDARAVMSKYNDTYLRRQQETQNSIKAIEQNSNLTWVEGKPVDPDADRLLSMTKDIAMLDSRKRQVESLLEQVRIAQDAGRPAEESLKLINTTLSSVLQTPADTINFDFERSDLRALTAAADNFESNVVVPKRIELKNESVMNGENHPRVKILQTALDELEKELAKKRDSIKAAEQLVRGLMGSDDRDAPSLQNQLKNSIGALTNELSKIEREKTKLREDIEAIRPSVQQNSQMIAAFLMNIAELEALSNTTKEVSEALNKLNSNSLQHMKTVFILEQAGIGAHVGPKLILYLGLGGMLGLALFSGLAYLLDLADRSYRTPDEIAVDLGMPIIGHLPISSLSRTSRVDDKVDTSIVTLHKSKSSISEAFRGIRTAVFFSSGQGAGIKVIQITSPVPGDGKSTVAANLAVSIAQSGRRVCIVDCDFRRPRVAKVFGLREDQGLAQVIAGKTDLEDAIQITSVENLSAVTCGRRPGNPAELLASESFADTLSELRNRFDFVIVDTPPVLVVSDPATVSSCVDGIILTVRLRRNLKPIAQRAAQMLHSMNANMLGVVVNGIGVGATGYGGYRYDSYSNNSGYGYGRTGYGGYGYGGTYQYGGYYGGSMVGRDYYADQDTAGSKK